MDTNIIFSILLGYILGSIPYGLVLCYITGYGDIRKCGSGNIGATNVLRCGNRVLALLTLILDSSKGAIAVLTAKYFWGMDMALCAGLLAVLGHIFPIWLKFKGGKGVATILGVVLSISLPVGILTCLSWLIVAFIFRISSLAAIVSLLLSPVFAYFFVDSKIVLFLAFLAIISIFMHRENVKRILAGTESKIGKK